MKGISVSVVGGSGLAGMEAVRLIHGHPDFQLHTIYANRNAGESFSNLFPAFRGTIDRSFSGMDQLLNDGADVLLFALPHGQSAQPIAAVLDDGYKGKIVDIGSDFRLKQADAYKTYYGYEHAYAGLLDQFVYGLPEFFHDDIAQSSYVAVPGCFATAIQLALLPAIIRDAADTYHITAITGSSGSGTGLSDAVHFSYRTGNMKAYKVLKHQHLGEINQTISTLSGHDADLRFTPVSGPFVRGIWLTASFTLSHSISLSDLYNEYYKHASFVRIGDQTPQLKHVVGSNYIDIGWQQKENAVVVCAAIDNLLKGAAGQAIQDLNIMYGLDEHSGLQQPGSVL
ncbi:MAG TPA: N-acetyl-gamma-glutamyl-phosphate reductase [Balneolales bacterium]|nr:N-acetyl-gamma-glutamyl-phosphate reductase [Balneolales bacterium]